MIRTIDVSGYTVSLDINECDQAGARCDVNADCMNTIGSFNCRCRPGYEGDGQNCTGTTAGHFLFHHVEDPSQKIFFLQILMNVSYLILVM